MKYLPIILFVVVVVGLLAFSARARRRQAESDERRRESIQVGTEVMTTSGLYGTVVALNDDDTVTLSIAPGVEVKWAFAALRDITSLPDEYRKGSAADGLDPGTQPSFPPRFTKESDPGPRRSDPNT